MCPRTRPFLLLATLLSGSIGSAWPSLPYSGCEDVTDAEFKATTIASNVTDKVSEPLKMAFDLNAAPGEDAKGKVDIYFTERKGNLRKFDARQNKVLTLGTFSLTIGASSSDGLIGIALDPDFKSNHWIYLYYTFKGPSETSWRVSRFTLDNLNEKIDMASEKVILKIPMIIGSQHPGGSMQFDAYGDLWITVGNDYLPGANEFAVWSSANTNDLRGKILRIHPTPEGGYIVPPGNLFPAGKFPPNKTKPEIYIMGSRHAYSLTLDPVRRWVTWGDVGSDEVTADGTPAVNPDGSPALTEEHDLATAPGNHGYPFFAGPNYVLKKGINPVTPIIPSNTDWGDSQRGLDTLPPAVPAVHGYKRACAITGPIYRYNGDLNSSIKLPPHFNRKWFVTDFNGNNPIVAITLSEDGKKIIGQDTVFKNIKLDRPLDFQSGPDGALYIANYAGYRTVTSATGIIRIEYTGDCRPADPKLELPTGLAYRKQSLTAASGLETLLLTDSEVNIVTSGRFEFRVTDLSGGRIMLRLGTGNAQISLSDIHKSGIYFLYLTTPAGMYSKKIFVSRN